MRELGREDLEALRGPRARLHSVERFRDSHHHVARLFASGLRPFEVAQACPSYGSARIMTLHADPAFQNLIAHYRDLVTKGWAEETQDFVSLATSNMLKAERQIADKLDAADAENETLPVKDLVSISRDAADRLGFGKHQTNLNVNVDFAARLDEAIKRSGKVITLQPNTGSSSRTPVGGPRESSSPSSHEDHQPFLRRV